MNEHYEIETLSDFLKVPESRLKACLAEFIIAIEMARFVELVSGDTPHPPPLEKFVWIDDDKKNITVNLKVTP